MASVDPEGFQQERRRAMPEGEVENLPPAGVRVAEILERVLASTAVVLHDRRAPNTRGVIDHIVVAASGVWVVDAKQASGKVERRNTGRVPRGDARLFVGNRTCSTQIEGLRWQVQAVHAAINADDVPVRPALSFVGVEWPVLFAKPFQVQGVWVSWPQKLAELIRDGQPALSRGEVQRVGSVLDSRLPCQP